MSSEQLEKNIFEKIFTKLKKHPKIISIFFIFLILIFSIYFYFNDKTKKENILISNDFNKAKILIVKKENNEAKVILENIIKKNNKFYSPMSLYLVIDTNLEKDKEKILELFNVVLSNKSLEQYNRNVILLKKGLFLGDFNDEQNMLKTLNPIVNSDSVWRPQAIKILGDYFLNKGDKQKSNEYYNLLKAN